MTPRRQLIIAAVAGVLVTVLFFFFVLTPKLSQISDVRGEIDTAKRTEGQLLNELKRLEEAKDRTVKTRDRLSKAKRFLPASPDLPGFIRLLQAAATKSGIDLRSMAPSPPQAVENTQGVQAIAVTLTVEGGFRRIEDFLSRLETLDRVVEVRSLSLTPMQNAISEQLTLSGTINMRMYVVQDDATVSGGTVRRSTPAPTGGNS